MSQTTKEAFCDLIEIRGIHNHLGVSSGMVRSFRDKIKTGKGISIDKMEEMLTKAGYKVIQEKLWKS